ncbi:hypothetical protein ACH5RR_030951 [Cinchona calisaya]|uniref:Uncharacterized protein n=1 Tax=Cinchona calisaya TaxID=153742 RepID=A0ABD2YHS3_9GENT
MNDRTTVTPSLMLDQDDVVYSSLFCCVVMYFSSRSPNEAMCVLYSEAEYGEVEIAECLAFADTEMNIEVIKCGFKVMAAYAFSI